MDSYKFGTKLDLEQSNAGKKLLKYHFTKDASIESGLIWCRLKENPLRFTLEEVKQLVIPNANELYFYLERSNEMYKTAISEVYNFVEKLEPWIDIDAYIFDDSYEWVMIITHDDDWLVIGL